ncbi:SWI/SNF nucleosome remodeling complex component-like [Rhopilema esculentum]|uniref:SWI/SNF nucleosome remodeling complex component-like n=1 Tax=Rhopilema esculentum TaxID=499914 RepID=UPI0031DB79F9
MGLFAAAIFCCLNDYTIFFPCSSFATSNDLLAHMVFSHAPQEGSMKACKVAGCKPVQRPRGSMICHFNQVHCNTSTVHDDEQVTLPQLLFPKVVDIEREDESPVTRTVRLTAALILRNIARNSPHGRKVILTYETRLVPSAMSASEASSAVSACLEELSRKRKKPSDSNTADVAS